jgi:cephalosporin hydroxylase
LVEGSLIAPNVVDEVRRHARSAWRILVVLSNHAKDHVLAELGGSPGIARNSDFVIEEQRFASRPPPTSRTQRGDAKRLA